MKHFKKIISVIVFISIMMLSFSCKKKKPDRKSPFEEGEIICINNEKYVVYSTSSYRKKKNNTMRVKPLSSDKVFWDINVKDIKKCI